MTIFTRIINGEIPSYKVAENDQFYAFLDISKLVGKKFGDEVIDGSLSFAKCALAKGVAVIPGVAFGDDMSIRLSYTISIDDINEGLNRLENFIKELK